MISLTSEQRQTVERRFRELAFRWQELTRYRSNIRSLRHHPIHQELIGLGEPALPLILEELAKSPSVSWFGLLEEISGENPVPAESAGRVAEMAEAWLEWGRSRGYTP
jgi:hypothetical protein